MSAQKSENEIVEINVGGVIHTTFWSTLESSKQYQEHWHRKSFVETFLTGENASRDSRGRHFIDANGRRFGYILDYLRGHSYLSDNVSLLRSVSNDAMRFEMGGLSKQIDSEIHDIIKRRREERRQEYLDRTRKPPEDSPPNEDFYEREYYDGE